MFLAALVGRSCNRQRCLCRACMSASGAAANCRHDWLPTRQLKHGFVCVWEWQVTGLQIASMEIDELMSDLGMSKLQAKRLKLYSGAA